MAARCVAHRFCIFAVVGLLVWVFLFFLSILDDGSAADLRAGFFSYDVFFTRFKD